MAIIRHQIPILEYDASKRAVIMPNHENLDLPKSVVFSFLGRVLDRYTEAGGAKVVGRFVSITKKYPIYVLDHRGEEITLCQVLIGAAAVQIMDV